MLLLTSMNRVCEISGSVVVFAAAFEHCVMKPYSAYSPGIVDGCNFIGSLPVLVPSVLA